MVTMKSTLFSCKCHSNYLCCVVHICVWDSVMQSCLLNCFASRLRLTWHDHLLQITRSIGDVYLKKPEFNREPLYSKFRLQETFRRPLLSSDPAITVHQIQPTDKFIIFASDGLWEHLSNQEAVDMVQSSPRNVCILILCLVSITWSFRDSVLNHVITCLINTIHAIIVV